MIVRIRYTPHSLINVWSNFFDNRCGALHRFPRISDIEKIYFEIHWLRYIQPKFVWLSALFQNDLLQYQRNLDYSNEQSQKLDTIEKIYLIYSDF